MAGVQLQIVVGGQQIAVPMVPASAVFDPLSTERMAVLLAESGYGDAQHIGETVQALRENGFHLPRAWAKPVRQELIDLDVGAGYVSGLIERFQREMVEQCGGVFVRMMRGDVQTDSEVAQKLLVAKHVPPMPPVSVDTGFAPVPDAWLAYYPQLVNWIRPTSAELAQTVQQVMDDPSVDDHILLVPAGDPRRIALGTVLRGTAAGMGQTSLLVGSEVLEAGDGVCILQAVNSKVLGKLASTMLRNWMSPRPITEEHLVVAAVIEWETQRKQLKKWGKLMVDDPDVALKSASQLLEGVPVVNRIIKNLDVVYGRSLEVQQIFDRVAIDSEHWLLEHNTSGGLNSSVGAAAVAAAAVK